MGNSSASFLPVYSCLDSNLSGNSVTPEYWDTHSISEDYKVMSMVMGIVTFLFFIVGLPSNLVIIVSIIIQKKKCIAEFILLNLAVADFLMCLLVLPFIMITGFAGSFVFGGSDYARCSLCQFGVVSIILSVFSIEVVCLISIDRFIFIRFPLRYKDWVTKCRIVVVLVFLWAFSIVQGVLPAFGIGEIKFSYILSTCTINLDDVEHVISNRQYGILLASLQVLPIVVTIVVNVWIACIVRTQVRKVYRTKRSCRNVRDLKAYTKSIRERIHKKRNKLQLSLIRAFGGIVVANVITWTPVIILILTLVIVEKSTVPLGYFGVSFLFYLMHPVVHPLIEGCFIPEIKTTLKNVVSSSLCCKLLRKTQHTAPDTSAYTGDTDAEQPKSSRLCCDVCSFAVLPDT